MRRGIPGRHTTSWRRLVLVGALGLGTAGCANLWDDVTSRDFKVKNLYTKPDPMMTLRENPDGDARARAMKALKEPARNGRPQDQDEAVNLLSQAAVTDPRPLCRLAAIDALGRFEDERCSAPLVQAYQNAADKTFTAEHVNTIRCESLAALGKKKTPEAATILLQVASQPKAEKAGTQLASLNMTDPLKKLNPPDDDDPVQRNMRLTAIRSGRSRQPASRAAADSSARRKGCRPPRPGLRSLAEAHRPQEHPAGSRCLEGRPGHGRIKWRSAAGQALPNPICALSGRPQPCPHRPPQAPRRPNPLCQTAKYPAPDSVPSGQLLHCSLGRRSDLTWHRRGATCNTCARFSSSRIARTGCQTSCSPGCVS